MRRKIIAAALALMMLGGLCALEQMQIHDICGDALDGAKAILAQVDAGEIQEAGERAKALDADWDRRGTRLEMFVDHKAVDDVRFALSRLIAAIQSEDRESAMIYASELEGGVEHVIERQEISIANIL